MALKYKKGEDPLGIYFRHHLLKLKIGLIVAITGNSVFRTGAGKSWTAIQLARQIDPQFSLRKVVYKPEDFLKVLQFVQQQKYDGQCVVIDEGGVSMGSGDFHTLSNKAMSIILQTFRILKCMVIFCVPNFTDLDVRARRLCSHQGWTVKQMVSGDKLLVYLDMRRLTVNLFKDDGKIWKRKISMYSAERGRPVIFKKYIVAKIPKYMAKEYEEYSGSFKTDLIKDWSTTLEKAKRKRDGLNVPEIEEVMTALRTDEGQLMNVMGDRGKVNKDMIVNIFQLTDRDARVVKHKIDRWLIKRDATEQVQE